MKHGEILVGPFATCRVPGVEHVIMVQGDEQWLCWKHPDGDWVTECRVFYTGDAAQRAAHRAQEEKPCTNCGKPYVAWADQCNCDRGKETSDAEQ